MSTEWERWVVELWEHAVALLISDEGERLDVARSLLPEGARPGIVVRVPRDEAGERLWSQAVVDEQATAERLKEATEILDDLRSRDPGGDVVL